MSKLLEIVGYDGITTGHKIAVNDMSYVHDELLSAVAYKTDTLQAIKDYYSRIAKNSLTLFQSEVMNYLSSQAKFSDTLMRFPEGRLTKGLAPFLFVEGQTVEQSYDLSAVLQYGSLKLESMMIYLKGSYNMMISVRMDYEELVYGENIFSETFEDLTAEEDFVTALPIDITTILADKLKINSKTQDRLIIEIQFLSDCRVYSQTFINIQPSVSNLTKEFNLVDGFSQGFSDAFSVTRGDYLQDVQPIISLVDSAINFDVDLFISKNADRLALCFALCIAARLLSDKLTGKRLNIFTNTDREVTKMQVEEIEAKFKQHMKMIATSLLFNINSTQTPPIELKGAVGYEMGSFVGDGEIFTGDDSGAYPSFIID